MAMEGALHIYQIVLTVVSPQMQNLYYPTNPFLFDWLIDFDGLLSWQQLFKTLKEENSVLVISFCVVVSEEGYFFTYCHIEYE